MSDVIRYMLLIKLDSLLTLPVLTFFSIAWMVFKWIIRGFTLFNSLMAIWIFCFILQLLLLNLQLDGYFFTIAIKTYTDTVAKFF